MMVMMMIVMAMMIGCGKDDDDDDDHNNVMTIILITTMMMVMMRVPVTAGYGGSGWLMTFSVDGNQGHVRGLFIPNRYLDSHVGTVGRIGMVGRVESQLVGRQG